MLAQQLGRPSAGVAARLRKLLHPSQTHRGSTKWRKKHREPTPAPASVPYSLEEDSFMMGQYLDCLNLQGDVRECYVTLAGALERNYHGIKRRIYTLCNQPSWRALVRSARSSTAGDAGTLSSHRHQTPTVTGGPGTEQTLPTDSYENSAIVAPESEDLVVTGSSHNSHSNSGSRDLRSPPTDDSDSDADSASLMSEEEEEVELHIQVPDAVAAVSDRGGRNGVRVVGKRRLFTTHEDALIVEALRRATAPRSAAAALRPVAARLNRDLPTVYNRSKRLRHLATAAEDLATGVTDPSVILLPNSEWT